MAKFSVVKDLVMGLEGDFEKFYDKDNQAAGTRVRKGMQDLKLIKVSDEPISTLQTYLKKMRRYSSSAPTLEEITNIVEDVRAKRYAKK